MSLEGNSRVITSNQEDINENLEQVVLKHLKSKFLKPYQQHTIDAFKYLEKKVESDGRPLIFDSCCGVGESTAILAKRHPNSLVIGMDKSGHRIGKQPFMEGDNGLLIQVDLNDLWRLAVEAQWQLTHHYLLYPNPWPKSKHLQRRWHGAAVFPYLLQLGGRLELRSNWRLYLKEFAKALELAGYKSQLKEYQSEQATTPFERKYWASGQTSWQLVTELS